MRLALILYAFSCVSAFADLAPVCVHDSCAMAFSSISSNPAGEHPHAILGACAPPFSQGYQTAIHPTGFGCAPAERTGCTVQAIHPSVLKLTLSECVEASDPELRVVDPRQIIGPVEHRSAVSVDETFFEEIRAIIPEGVETIRFRAP